MLFHVCKDLCAELYGMYYDKRTSVHVFVLVLVALPCLKSWPSQLLWITISNNSSQIQMKLVKHDVAPTRL